ncbi:Crp/Fnr family transcriptional regulator [Streptomyces sp. 8N706]|uniref:Crp/Fnr family transcriptional regulator n=1 Tax=Streptomyces sp. 8N706 TaxID=3457416 RepID=UPI003FD3C07A
MNSRGSLVSRPGRDHWPPAGLLGGLSPETRAGMLSLGRPVRFEGGERLLREGEHGSHVFLLLHGWFKVLAATDDGREALMAVRSGGDVVGELACFDAQPRVATVRAVGAGSARLIGRQEFLAFLAVHDDAGQAVMRAVAGKLRWATRRRQEFGGCPISTRVARVLVEMVRVHGQVGSDGISIGAALTQPDLAALVGASEPSVHRTLRSLRQDGTIETGYRRILVRDVGALCRIAGIDAVVELALRQAGGRTRALPVTVPSRRPPTTPQPR